MDIEGTLLTLAELAVALAGFAGVVTAFQRRARPWTRHDSMRLWNMLRFALALLFFALLPLAWVAADSDPWVICTALLGLTVAGQAGVSSWLAITRPPGTQLFVALFLGLGGAIVAAVILLSAAGALLEQPFAAYFIGLLWLVLASALFFVRLVYLGLADTPAEEASE